MKFAVGDKLAAVNAPLGTTTETMREFLLSELPGFELTQVADNAGSNADRHIVIWSYIER